MAEIIDSLEEVADRYDALFVDLWGCLHNGYRPFPGAVEALQAYRRRGGAVILVTNAPRPRGAVERQLAKIGAPRDCWDSLATSGDSARASLFQGVVGRRVYHIGEPTDLSFFEPLGIEESPVEITRTSLEEAEGIVCTGPADPHADIRESMPDFRVAIGRKLKLLCANPDIVVDRGSEREWCAGALARLYTEMGGESLYFGKPSPPIYSLARKRLEAAGHKVPDSRILCVGDGIDTDIRGGVGEGLDTLFITGGLSARETLTESQPDPGKLRELLGRKGLEPTFAIGSLR